MCETYLTLKSHASEVFAIKGVADFVYLVQSFGLSEFHSTYSMKKAVGAMPTACILLSIPHNI